MKKVILRSPMRTRSNSLTTLTNEYLTVKFKPPPRMRQLTATFVDNQVLSIKTGNN
jgi:hypothetical protein